MRRALVCPPLLNPRAEKSSTKPVRHLDTAYARQTIQCHIAFINPISVTTPYLQLRATSDRIDFARPNGEQIQRVSFCDIAWRSEEQWDKNGTPATPAELFRSEELQSCRGRRCTIFTASPKDHRSQDAEGCCRSEKKSAGSFAATASSPTKRQFSPDDKATVVYADPPIRESSYSQSISAASQTALRKSQKASAQCNPRRLFDNV